MFAHGKCCKVWDCRILARSFEEFDTAGYRPFVYLINALRIIGARPKNSVWETKFHEPIKTFQNFKKIQL